MAAQATAGSFLLQQLGIHLDMAQTGAEALALLRSSRRYHLVIFDLTLPDMSGYAVCSAYTQHCEEKGLPSALKLALTAGAADTSCTDFGFARCLTKPLSSVSRALPVVAPPRARLSCVAAPPAAPLRIPSVHVVCSAASQPPVRLAQATVVDLLRMWLASPGAREIDDATSGLAGMAIS